MAALDTTFNVFSYYTVWVCESNSSPFRRRRADETRVMLQSSLWTWWSSLLVPVHDYWVQYYCSLCVCVCTEFNIHEVTSDNRATTSYVILWFFGVKCSRTRYVHLLENVWGEAWISRQLFNTEVWFFCVKILLIYEHLWIYKYSFNKGEKCTKRETYGWKRESKMYEKEN